MPIYDYLCPDCGKRETVVYLTFKEAEPYEDKRPCDKCGKTAHRQLEIPFPGMMMGNPEGYYKPAASAKRIVNPDTISFEGGKGEYTKTD